MATFYRTLCEVEPTAKDLITYGQGQIAIAYDLADDGLRGVIGSVPNTPLADGIAATLQRFRQLAVEGRLDTADLDTAPPPAVTVAVEP
jgi:hypothetical protein